MGQSLKELTSDADYLQQGQQVYLRRAMDLLRADHRVVEYLHEFHQSDFLYSRLSKYLLCQLDLSKTGENVLKL